MRRHSIGRVTSGVLCALATGACGLAAGGASLDARFENPPQSCGVNVWWHWQGGNVTKYGITRDLEAMKRAGVSSATIFNIQDVGWDSKERFREPLCPIFSYMNPAWFGMVKFAIAEAKRLGLGLGLHNCPGYSTSGGPWITPALGMKKLVWTKDGAEPERVLGFYRDIARVETTNGVYRFGYTCTGKCTHPAPPEMETASLEADKMSLKAVDTHLDHLLDNLRSNGIVASDPGLAFILMDSYEAGDSSWTDDFAEEFRRRRGYDPIPFLPVMAGLGTKAGDAKDEQFRRDFTRTKHELQTERHYRRFKERLNAAGYEFHLEPYTGPFDSFEASQYCDVAMTEFWEGHPFWGWDDERKGGACWMAGPVARALGRTVCGAESFTGYPLDDPFAFTPRDLKRSFDASMARGLNRLSLHHWEHQPLHAKWQPGFSMGAWGTHFGENQTWFEPGLPFYRYMQRVQALLQAGTMRADDLGVSYTIGEDSDALPYSNFLTNVEATAAGRLRVKSSGREYALISINPEMASRASAPWDAVEARVFARLAELKRSGVAVCADVDKKKALAQLGLAPLFEVTGADPKKVLATAREADGALFWFVANTGTNDVDCTVRLRLAPGSGTRAEAWDPETGGRFALNGFAAEKGVLAGRLALAAESSLFIVVRPSADPNVAGLPSHDPPARRGAALSVGGWTLSFAPGRGAPEGPRKIRALESWTQSDVPGIRYFSGTATYETTVDVPEDGRYELDLGDVRDLAEVFVDGRFVMTLWHRPFRRTLALKAGRRRLAVKVTNAWTNRLIGDDREPDDCILGSKMGGFDVKSEGGSKFVPVGKPVIGLPEAIRTDGERKVRRFAFSTWRYSLTDADLRPAGLLGPVKILAE